MKAHAVTRNLLVAIATVIIVGLGIAFQITTATTHDDKPTDTGTHAPQENPNNQTGKPGEVKD